MNYTLHAAPGSCSLAPHIVLEEIGEKYQLALMSPGHPETRTAEFQALNPKGRIPVLTHKTWILTEAPAILVHLGVENPSLELLDTSAEQLVRTMEWFNWLSGAVHAVAVRMIWRPDYFSSDENAHPGIVANGHKHLLECFSLIENKLSANAWAVGDRYSIVDPYLLVFYRWGNRMQINMQAKLPAWTAHTRRLENRPAVLRALEQEGISLWK